MSQAFHDSPARLEAPFGSAEGRADPRLVGYGPGTRCGDRRSFHARSRVRGQAWGAAEDAGQFLRATVARAARSTRGPVSPAPRSRTLGQRTATGPMPVWISRSGKYPWRTTRRRPFGRTEGPLDLVHGLTIRQIGVSLDESRHLHLNRLRQKTPCAQAQNLRQRIL